MRKLGNSDLHITRVGYGAWAIGGSGWQFAWGSQDDNESIAAIHRALELGVNWIDTAAVYGLGHSEEVVGRALKSWRGSRPYVFTKCGLRGDANGEVQKVLDPDSIRGEVEDSLRRLSVDVIDLYQILKRSGGRLDVTPHLARRGCAGGSRDYGVKFGTQPGWWCASAGPREDQNYIYIRNSGVRMLASRGHK